MSGKVEERPAFVIADEGGRPWLGPIEPTLRFCFDEDGARIYRAHLNAFVAAILATDPYANVEPHFH